ncbi:unnamed protein product [Polarella glacialis]|uniref:Uncharacterized protein n=1 Tax=Polarella glacialis TaxID=89957 RepID=A0A813J767_POLGL|nr:unnamed protein product [Polarella glacialis]CAE8676028.1 unnamed protein product [Polarella glacialis]|mmetsp:Transcript_75700/g.136527  ORF Transcript_75700/g.136527 Transcript_75700/m.136527 type:complete len:156 (-) Transcript_75700:10-477(-)
MTSRYSQSSAFPHQPPSSTLSQGLILRDSVDVLRMTAGFVSIARTTKFCRCCGLEDARNAHRPDDVPAVKAMSNALQAARQALDDMTKRSAPFSLMTQVWNNFFIVYVHLFRYHNRELTESGCDKGLVQNAIIDKGIECGMLSNAQVQELKSLII